MNTARSPSSGGDAADVVALRRVSAGDVGALGDVYDRHARSILEFATRAVGSSDAEDVVHTVFLRAARLAGTFDDRTSSARPWLFGIAAKVIQERRRSFVRSMRAFLRLSSTASSASTPTLDLRGDIERALGVLSEPKRVVVLLADLEGFTCDEIAGMLGIPVGTVWTRLHHARRELRDFCSRTP